MTKYIWHNEAVPDNLKIKQVHAVLVTADGRILLRIKNGAYRLTGGHPEPQDTDAEATVRREALEEADVEVDKIDYIGYQEVNEKDGAHYAQMRMVARVSNILSATPDPDRSGSWTYGRILVAPDEARRELPFGEINAPLIDNAIRIARSNNYFTEPINVNRELLNQEDKQSEDES
jgi:8-oxo-dGTP pyrophosphatase MutT (NUDIX family)